MGVALEIRADLSADELRWLARGETDGRAAARMYAIAHALEGMSRAQAARLAGMERQALRDAVARYNAEGLAGLHDRPKGRPPLRLSEGEEATLSAVILRGPAPAGWRVRLDPSGSVSLDAGALRQDLPPLQHDPGSAPHGLLSAEGAPGAPAEGCASAAALQKRGSQRP